MAVAGGVQHFTVPSSAYPTFVPRALTENISFSLAGVLYSSVVSRYCRSCLIVVRPVSMCCSLEYLLLETAVPD